MYINSRTVCLAFDFRLFSAYTYYWGSQKKSGAIFHDLVVKAIALMKECIENRPVRFCLYDSKANNQTLPVCCIYTFYYYKILQHVVYIIGHVM